METKMNIKTQVVLRTKMPPPITLCEECSDVVLDGTALCVPCEEDHDSQDETEVDYDDYI